MGDSDELRRHLQIGCDTTTISREPDLQICPAKLSTSTMFPRIPFHRVNWLVSSFLIGTLFLSITAVPVYLWFFGIDLISDRSFLRHAGCLRILYHPRVPSTFFSFNFPGSLDRAVLYGHLRRWLHLRIPFFFGPANIAAIISMWITMTILIVSPKVSFMPTWAG